MASSTKIPKLLAWDLFILATFIKVLLIPAYYSTDFDVHRNWLALTNALPLADWYHEKTSQWTLDYPPFFAYFEYLLSLLVPLRVVADGGLDIVAADGQYGWPTVVFQRVTVIVTEIVFAASLYSLGNPVLSAILWVSPSWLILDHIHFQYNTAMFGIFVFSVSAMIRKQFLKSAFLFAVLLCFKHIYLYVAPAYFAYLLRHYALKDFSSLLKLGAVTLTPFVAAFAPLLYVDHKILPQILSRLFPFSRGLTHAYWAPNFWALYSFVDRVLGVYFKNSAKAATRGVVGQVEFANLPDITPRTTFLITLAFQVIVATPLAVYETTSFVEGVTLCGFASFLFGWHVHEKAIMVVLVPFALCCCRSSLHMNAFLPLAASSCFSLFPLIWTPMESLFKVSYTMAYLIVLYVYLPKAVEGGARVNWLVSLYTLGFGIVMPASSLIPLALPKFEYAGLMLISVYSALGVFWSWFGLSYIYFVKNGNATRIERTDLKR